MKRFIKLDAGTPIAAPSSLPGGISLCAPSSYGLVQRTYFDPRGGNLQWSGWFALPADQPFGAGTSVAAVSSVPGGVSLFAKDTEGQVWSTYYNPRVANAEWAPRFSLPVDQPFGAGTPIVAVSSVTGGVSLFATGTDGQVKSTYYDPRVDNPQWAPWFSLPADQPFGPGTPVAAVSSVPGGVSLFATGTDGQVRSTYYG